MEDQMADKSNPNFEVTPEMRAFAEKSVEQAKKAMDGFIAAARQTASAAETHAKTVHSHAKEAGELAMRHAGRNIDSSFEFAQSLVRAKDAEEVMKLQADYMKQQMTVMAEQVRELGQKATKSSS
jgi:phasin